MFDFRIFDDVFNFEAGSLYEASFIKKIEDDRKKLEGLFIDRVLRLLDIKRPAKVYPPKNDGDLETLHQLVVSADSADHTKLSVLYYLLLDCENGDPKLAASDTFCDSARLPVRNQLYMHGLWHMDRMQFSTALQYLTHPSLVPTFHEEILETLVRTSQEEDYSLALAYYHTVQPSLKSEQSIRSLLCAMVRTSVSEAFLFTRSQNEQARKQMFELLISVTLQARSNDNTASRAIELINLPFTSEEESWFNEFLTTGQGRNLRKAKDTMMMRRIGTGRYDEASSVEGLDARVVGGLSWAMMHKGMSAGLSSSVKLS